MANIIYKATVLFDYSPEVNNAAKTRIRSGGFSESWYQLYAPTPLTFTQFANVRAPLMYSDLSMVGWRSTELIYTGNQVVQGQVTTGDLAAAGAYGSGVTIDPETCLILRGVTGASKAQTRYILHAIPASQIYGSQFVPTGPFKKALDLFIVYMLTPGKPQYWFGRDPGTAKQRVVSYNPATFALTTLGNTGAVAGNYVRFFRVRDDLKNPVEGSFLVNSNTPVAGTGNWLLLLASGPNMSVITPSGYARIDQLAATPLTAINPHLIGDRKIGRPFSLFRGRRTA